MTALQLAPGPDRVLPDKAYSSRPTAPTCGGVGSRRKPTGSATVRIRVALGAPVATVYDKLAVRYEATRHIAAINEWLRSGFLNTP